MIFVHHRTILIARLFSVIDSERVYNPSCTFISNSISSLILDQSKSIIHWPVPRSTLVELATDDLT